VNFGVNFENYHGEVVDASSGLTRIEAGGRRRTTEPLRLKLGR